MRLPLHTLDRAAEELGRSGFLRLLALIALLTLVVIGLDALANAIPNSMSG